MKLIYWRAFALLLSWELLGFILLVINIATPKLDAATFGAILIASVGYMIATVSLFKPFTK